MIYSQSEQPLQCEWPHDSQWQQNESCVDFVMALVMTKMAID